MRFVLSLLFVFIAFGIGLTAFIVGPQGVREYTRAWIPSDLQTRDAVRPPEVAAATAEVPSQVPDNQRAIRRIDGLELGAWRYDCPKGEKRDLCVIAFQLTDQKSGAVVFSWLIGADRAGKFQGNLQTPTGVMVNRGVVLDVGTPQPIAVPYTACVPGYCEAVANLAPDFVDTLAETQKATATINTVDGKALTFTIPVDGLSDGIMALRHPDR